MNRNVGKFVISNALLFDKNAQEAVMKIMGKVIIVRAEQLYAKDGIEYVALSDFFRELPFGCEPPLYTFSVDSYGEITCI